jgi:hypothetical protein
VTQLLGSTWERVAAGTAVGIGDGVFATLGSEVFDWGVSGGESTPLTLDGQGLDWAVTGVANPLMIVVTPVTGRTESGLTAAAEFPTAGQCRLTL